MLQRRYAPQRAPHGTTATLPWLRRHYVRNAAIAVAARPGAPRPGVTARRLGPARDATRAPGPPASGPSPACALAAGAAQSPAAAAGPLVPAAVSTARLPAAGL